MFSQFYPFSACILNAGGAINPVSVELTVPFLDVYRNLPNEGTGRSSKVRSDKLSQKLRSSAFQRWFQIENRTIIKETMPILAIYDSIGFLKTKGAPLLGEAPLIGRLRYVKTGKIKKSGTEFFLIRFSVFW